MNAVAHGASPAAMPKSCAACTTGPPILGRQPRARKTGHRIHLSPARRSPPPGKWAARRPAGQRRARSRATCPTPTGNSPQQRRPAAMPRQARRPAPDLPRGNSPDLPALTGPGLAPAQTNHGPAPAQSGPDPTPAQTSPSLTPAQSGPDQPGKHPPRPAQGSSPSTRTPLSATAASTCRPTTRVLWRQARPGHRLLGRPAAKTRENTDPVPPASSSSPGATSRTAARDHTAPSQKSASTRKPGRLPPASHLHYASPTAPPRAMRSSPRPPPGHLNGIANHFLATQENVTSGPSPLKSAFIRRHPAHGDARALSLQLAKGMRDLHFRAASINNLHRQIRARPRRAPEPSTSTETPNTPHIRRDLPVAAPSRRRQSHAANRAGRRPWCGGRITGTTRVSAGPAGLDVRRGRPRRRPAAPALRRPDRRGRQGTAPGRGSVRGAARPARPGRRRRGRRWRRAGSGSRSCPGSGCR